MKVTFDAVAIGRQLGDAAEEVLQRAVDALGEQARANLLKASDTLPAIKQKVYRDALNYDRRKTSVVIELRGKEANDIETGAESKIDMKPKLLASQKAKTAKDGSRYIDIPFQHRTTKRGKGIREVRRRFGDASAHD